MHGFWMMTSLQSMSPIGGEGNSQSTHGSIMVELRPKYDKKCRVSIALNILNCTIILHDEVILVWEDLSLFDQIIEFWNIAEIT